MLPLSSRIGFAVFAVVMLGIGARGFCRVYLRVRRGRPDSDLRWDRWPARLRYAIRTTLTQQRTFRKRGWVSFFHAFIFYGFVFYLLVNLVDAAGGYGFELLGALRVFLLFGQPGMVAAFLLSAGYLLLADVLSLLVLVGVVALVARRFLLPARQDFRFNARTLLHQDVQSGYVSRDSVLVSIFILFHVGSRAIGAGARIAAMPMDKFNAVGNEPLEPFGSLLAHLFTPQNAHAWQVFGYWGALGSVLLFLAYFPYSKHLHIFAAPAKYFFAREGGSGVLPMVDIDLETEEQAIGAHKLEDLPWPRLLDAYACIQCNRCQDVCPATATGKSLSPAALEINKRMELNRLSGNGHAFEQGASSPHPLLQFALTPEAAWACTTCGACMEVCPVQDEQMLDIVDIRRHQVMIAGDFPTPLQSAFRGMERSKNPWGINHDRRLEWAEGLGVKTIDDHPTPDVLYWVGCAASYDPGAQATARAFVQLLHHADVDFAVLGKRECCTGDSARRAGNELLYRELAEGNVATLNDVRPKLIVASCPHCMNALGNEYKQIGGHYKVMHHSQYLQMLVDEKRLNPAQQETSVAFHDPCYLGRHNGVYDAPRNVLRVLSSDVVELKRNREDSFCCGAGGAQFWKEEESGDEQISENRFREVRAALSTQTGEKVLAVGCPFCKSMLGSTPGKAATADIAVKDIAELLLQSIRIPTGEDARSAPMAPPPPQAAVSVSTERAETEAATGTSEEKAVASVQGAAADENPECSNPLLKPVPERKKWQPKAIPNPSEREANSEGVGSGGEEGVVRRKWTPMKSAPESDVDEPVTSDEERFTPIQSPAPPEHPAGETSSGLRKKWKPKTGAGREGEE